MSGCLQATLFIFFLYIPQSHNELREVLGPTQQYLQQLSHLKMTTDERCPVDVSSSAFEWLVCIDIQNRYTWVEPAALPCSPFQLSFASKSLTVLLSASRSHVQPDLPMPTAAANPVKSLPAAQMACSERRIAGHSHLSSRQQRLAQHW